MQPLANALLTTLAILTLSANQNVWSMQNAPGTRLASIRNAKIPVLGFAALTPIAQPPIIMQCASVNQDTPATHSLHVKESPHVSYLFEMQILDIFIKDHQECQQRDQTLAIHLHVGQMHFVLRETMLGHADAFLNILGTPMWLAGLNVQSILIAPQTRPVSSSTVWIHALACVAPMPSAE